MSTGTLALPKLYAIIDAANFGDQKSLLAFTRELAHAGVTLMQYRDKSGSGRQVLSSGQELKRMGGPRVRLIMNDRADLCLAAGFDGVHLGQDDMGAESARRVLGDGKIVGRSTHNLEQAMVAGQNDSDYVAIGPIFETRSKAQPDPVVGIAGLKEIRRHVKKPLVAIGGITRQNCADVMAAGADSVAVISDLMGSGGRDSAVKRVEEFLRRLE